MKMNQEKAKELLGGIRPEDHADARLSGEPELVAALDLLENDAELQAWYADECALDEAFSKKLSEAAAIPSGLKASLLGALEETQPSHAGSQPVPFRGGWILAAAAAVALLMAVGVKMFRSPDGGGTSNPQVVNVDGELSFVSFRNEMADYANTRISLAHKASDWEVLSKWLRGKKSVCCGKLPDSIADLEALGCNVVDWGSKHVSLYCFKKGGTGEVVHLFVMDKENVCSVPACDDLHRPLVTHGVESVGWQDEEKVYLLVGSKPGVKVSELL